METATTLPETDAQPGEAPTGAQALRTLEPSVHLLRFDRYHRLLHLMMMTSFLGLAATGLPLLFNDAPWAARLAQGLGGFSRAGSLHRTFAVLLIVCFGLHVGRLLDRLMVKRELGILWGPASMVPQPRDVIEMMQHVRWFLGLGPRPRFDHFTYWEKFDYWAVFWGMGIIGASGLVLWFPIFFSKFLPGWLFNVALLIHGEEALLAVAFIFTIHFFNTHLRPEKFPLDTVIFTGRISADELRAERPAEFARLQRDGTLDQLIVDPPAGWLVAAGPIVGAVAVTIGLGLFALIMYAVFA